jgi:hypothetical protein
MSYGLVIKNGNPFLKEDQTPLSVGEARPDDLVGRGLGVRR